MIYQATLADVNTITDMGLLLFNGNDREELRQEFVELLSKKKECAIFIAELDSINIGFAQVQLRHDYVEGTESSPVGYLEGIYVKEEYRKCGYAVKLLQSCEQWAKEQGCTEFASDCELTNDTSLAFHLKAGFTEANRIICFTKQL